MIVLINTWKRELAMRVTAFVLCVLSLVGCSGSSSESANKQGVGADTSQVPGPVGGGRAIPAATASVDKKVVNKSDPLPKQNPLSDAQIGQLLIGSWDEKATFPDQSVLERQITFLQTGTMNLRGTMRYRDASQVPLIVAGTWKVIDAKLQIVVQTSNAPNVVPIGSQSLDPILNVNATEFSYQDATSKQVRILRRATAKSEPVIPKQIADAEYERLLRNGPWIDQFKQPNGVVVMRRIAFDLRGEWTGSLRLVGGKDVRIALGGTWQVLNGVLHILIKTSTQPEVVAIGSKSADVIKHVTTTEFSYIDSATKLVRVMKRDAD